MKTGKEIKDNSYESFKVSIGTVNNRVPTSVYIKISGWANPLKEEELNYDRVISGLKKRISARLHEYKSPRFHNHRTIVDLDMRSSGVRYGKKSFTDCEITLFQKDLLPVNNVEVKNHLFELTNTVISEVLENDDYFTFTKVK
tara:strand:- start:115 stop:543 length:429 start_codon:yes stop_codon:yes gene_type:complete